MSGFSLGAEQTLRVIAWIALASSAVLIFAAPLWMAEGYSAWRHGISESAGQGVAHGGWARAGLAALGLAALAVAALSGRRGPALTSWALAAFGVAMMLSAVWSHAPWAEGVEFDALEARRHSLAAQAAGMAMVLALGGRVALRWTQQRSVDLLDLSALGLSVFVPLAWALRFPWPGAVQRAMFLLAYLWLAREAAHR